MKVPHNIVGRTRPTAAGMDPLRVNTSPEGFGAAIGRGLGDLAQGLAQFQTQVKAREDKTQRFQAMTNFSEFETQANTHMAELKRSADPTGLGYTKMAEEEYDKMAEAFITKSVAPELQEEARYWTSNTKQRILADSMQFQYEAGDAYFRQGINTEYQNALKGLDPATGGDPAQLEMWREKMEETIDASDLSETEKMKLKWDTSVGLEGVVYKQAYKKQIALGKSQLPSHIGPIVDEAAAKYGEDAETLKAIAWIESRGRPDAQNDKSSAGGLFQQTDGNARDYGVVDRFDPVQSAEGAARFMAANRKYLRSHLGREPTPGELYLAHQQGPQGAVNILAYPNRLAVDMVGKKAVLNNGGTLGMTAGEFANLWNTKLAKAQGIDLDQMPAFSHLPYEDRIALQQDGQSEFTAEQNAAAAAQKLQIEGRFNELMTNIHDGRAGQMEIEAARAEGWLTDYDQIVKAEKAFADRNEGQGLIQEGLTRLGAKETFDPTSEHDKKVLNSLIGDGGLRQLEDMNQNYVNAGLVPMVTDAAVVPSTVAGHLTGMVRSNNQQKALFAYETLAQLQDADPRAFDNAFTDRVAADLNFYRARRTAMPADQLLEAINGGRTQQERQGREILYQEAQDILKTRTEGVATISSLVQEFAGEFEGSMPWSSSAQGIGIPSFAKQMTMDYQTAFIDAYMMFPDKDQAHQQAVKMLKRDWALSPAGGGILMKHPPELSGYPALMGNHDWIEIETRQELGLKDGEKYQLISDDKTASELNKFRQGLGPVPSYQVVTIDAAGTPRLKMFSKEVGAKGQESFIETGNPARIRFEPNPRWKRAEKMDFEVKKIERKLSELYRERETYINEVGEASPEVEAEIEALEAERDGQKEIFEKTIIRRPQPPEELPPSLLGPMEGPLGGF